MMKFVRNTLGNIFIIVDGDARHIKWEFIKRLEDVQSRDGVLLANKLRKKRIDYKNKKIKTSLATQTLNISVAAGLQYFLSQNNGQFSGCEATMDFITIFNNLFYIFNSKCKYS